MKKILASIIIMGLYTPSLFAGSNVLSSDNGRYVFGQISDTRKDQYLLDTKTGKLWNIVINKDGIAQLSPMVVENVSFDAKGKPIWSKSNIPK